MTDNLIRPVLGEQEMVAVVDRLTAIWEAVSDDIRNAKPTEPHFYNVGTILSQQVRSRMDAVEDRASGLNWAVWCIGETLATCGGMGLMQLAFGMFEDANGTRAASWLDHRWSEIEIPGGGWWLA